MAWSGVHHLVDSWQGITIFWALSIEVDEVYVDSPFVICFLHHDRICNPLRIGGFFIEASIEQFVDLGYSFLVLGCKTFFLLFDESMLRIYFQLVYHHQGIDAWQSAGAQAKISIFFYKNKVSSYLVTWSKLEPILHFGSLLAKNIEVWSSASSHLVRSS